MYQYLNQGFEDQGKECLPFSVLYNTAILGPSEPAGTWLSLILLIKHTDNARYITRVW